MHTQLAFIRFSRNNIVKMLEDLSLGQINHIPEGYNNNLAWQLGHVTASLQSYCYGNAGLQPLVEQSFIDQYKGGTKPESNVTEEEVITLKNLAISTLDQFEKDLADNKFANFTAKVLGNGIAINSIEDAVEMMVFHEALHCGESKILKRIIANA
jgi:hypothetical protein